MVSYDKNKMLKIKILWIFLAAIVFLIGAVWWVITPSEKDRAMFTEDEKRRCLDNFCQGDVMPKSYESVQKINHQWFIGPREYFNGFGAAHFIWWDHKPLGQKISYPSEIQKLAEDGKSDIFQIKIFFRSYAIPPEPRGYARFEKFEKEGRVLERKTLRKGLDSLRIKGDDGNLSTYTTYVATELKGFDGLPPVVACGPPPINDASTGFFWHYGVYVDIRMHTQHCADWPEIYQEIQRVIQLLKKVEQ